MVLLVYAWAAYGSNRGNFLRSTAGGFYPELADAFLAGQTHLKFAPDPALKNLADPYLDSPWLPRLHDATYFRGRYYLYFGPGAAVLLYAPWQLLSGTSLSDGAGAAILIAVGFLLGCMLLWKMWWRWFGHSLAPGWLIVAVLLWGFGNYTFLLIDVATFYFVPIAFSYAICVGSLLALWQAVTSSRWRGALGWFALASFLWAAALSGRPNYLFSLPVLVFPFFHLRAAAARRFGRRNGGWQLFFAGALPVAAIGITLAAYNWVRYGKLTEFGVHYQFAMGDQRQTKLFETANFWVNFKSYLFSFPDLSPYFPFTSDVEFGYSLIRCAPLLLVAFLFPASLLAGKFRTDPVWRTLGLTFGAGFILNFISLLGVPWANERYFGDFTPLLMLLAVASLWFSVDALASRVRAARVARLTFGALAGWTFLFGAIFIVARYPYREALAPVRRFAIGLAYRVEQLRHIGHGPVHLQVVFGTPPVATVEPLVVSGHGRDLLFVKYLGQDLVQFGFFHAGNPAVYGEPVEITRGKPQRLDINLGSLYPPSEHPLMKGWSAVQIEMLKSTVTVRLDGNEVLNTHSVFYPTHPDDVRIGSNPNGLLAVKRFSGTLASAAPRAMPTPADLAARHEEGPVRLTLTLPPFTVFRSEPLVSTGHRGAGDVVYVSYIKKNGIRFGHDSSNNGSAESETVTYDPARTHVVEIDMGSLRSSTGTQMVEAPLVIRFDGRTLLDERRFFNPSSADQVVFGFNGMGSGIVAEAFGGHISEIKTLASLDRTPLLAQAQGYGAVHFTLKFPHGAAGRSEPLLVTGKTGKGDICFVTYLDETRVKFGVDHWGVGAAISEPVTLDLEQDHAVDVSIGSLFPADTDPWWASTPPDERRRRQTRVIVQLDGVTVLDQLQAAHPTTPEQVAAGTNLIGASSCGPTFRGKIFTASRLPPPPSP